MDRQVTRSAARPLDQQDLAICALLAVGAVLAVVLELPAAIRLLLAVPLALFLPGYGLLSALLPRGGLATVERAIIAVGASVALTIIGGIALALSPVRLSPLSWSVMLAAVSLATLALAWRRRTVAGVAGPRFSRPAVPLAGAVMILIASLLLADVLLGARFIAGQQFSPPPEQLWMLPTESARQVRLGMQAGAGGGEYVIRLSSAGETVAEYALELAETEQWQTELTVSAEQRAGPLVARLYEGGGDIELRFVVLQPATTGD